MAILALGVIGAGLGTAALGAGVVAFGMTGTAIGWTLGTIAGSLLFPPKGSHTSQQGPRISDNKIQTSTYGQAIPKVYGRARIAGNIIWSSDIIETAHVIVQESGGGGKGGGGGSSQTSTTYTYHIHIAIGLCEGAIVGVRKIWANGRLIYNIGDTVDANTIYASNKRSDGITVYTGDTTQLPSSLMESYQGAGNVPAYRNLAYVVFNDFQLEDFGNNVPALEFEVISQGTLTLVTGGISGATEYWSPPSDQVGGCTFDSSTAVSGNTNNRCTHGIDSNDYFSFSRLWVTLFNGQHHMVAEIRRDFNGAGFNDQRPSVIVDNIIATTYFYGGGRSMRTGGIMQGDRKYLVWTDNFATGWSAGKLWMSWDMDNNVLKQIEGPGTIGSSWTPIMSCARYGNHLYVKCWVWNGWACNLFYVDMSAPYPAAVILSASGVNVGDYLFADVVGLHIGKGPDGGHASFGFKSYAHGTLTEIASIAAAQGTTLTGMERLDDGAFITEERSSLWHTSIGGVRTNLGTVPAQYFSSWAYGAYKNGVWGTADHEPSSGIVNKWYGVAVSSTGTIALSVIVQDLCLQSGLLAGDINVAALTDQVRGYVKGSRVSLRAALEPLMIAYSFDGLESDGKVKFVKRGGAVAATFDNDDLAAHESGSDIPAQVLVTRQSDLEMPDEITVAFINENANYEQGAQYARRTVPASNSQVSVELPVVLSDNEARQIAERVLYSLWQSRQDYRWSTSRKYVKYDPADVINLPVTGENKQVRIRQRDEGANGIVQWEGSGEDAAVYTQTLIAQTPLDPISAVSSQGPTDFRLLDIPLLRASDNSYGFYAAAAGLMAAWKGGVAHIARDGIAYLAIPEGVFLGSATMGKATLVLATVTNPHQWDEAKTVNVELTSGALSSVTRAQALTGQNVILLGTEVILFTDATLVSGTTYKLSGMLRGRLGTDIFMGDHAIGESFVLLNATYLRFLPMVSSDVGQLYPWKCPSFTQVITDATAISATYQGNNLKPLHPVHVAGGRNHLSDIIIKWARQTRLPAVMRDYVDAPLGEDTESYEVDIMSGSTVKRTLASSTKTVTYLSADQTTDFGAPQSSLVINVYQLSAQVGRGFAENETV